MAESTKGTGALIVAATTPTISRGIKPYTDLAIRDGEDLQQQYDYVRGELTLTAPSDNPTALEFLSWHSLQQLDLIPDLVLNTDGTIASGVTTIGTSPDTITVVKATDGSRVYVIEHLQKGDISRIPADDLKVIAQTDAWKEIAVGLGMVPDTETTLAAAKTNYTDTIQLLQGRVLNPECEYADPAGFEEVGDILYERLELLLADIEAAEALSPEEIGAKIFAIEEDYLDLLAFYDLPNSTIPDREDFEILPFFSDWEPREDIDDYVIYNAEEDGKEGIWVIYDGLDYNNDTATENFASLPYHDVYDFESNPYKNIISTDGDAFYKQCFDQLVAVQKKKFELEKTLHTLSADGTLGGKKLDGAGLIAMFMQVATQLVECDIQEYTILVDAANEVGKRITRLVEFLNAFIATAFAGTGPNAERAPDIDEVSLEDLLVVVANTTDLGGGLTPIERRAGLEPLTLEMLGYPTKQNRNFNRFDNHDVAKANIDPDLLDNDRVHRLDTSIEFREYPKTTWDTFVTTLLERKSLISQVSQKYQSKLSSSVSTQTNFQSNSQTILQQPMRFLLANW